MKRAILFLMATLLLIGMFGCSAKQPDFSPTQAEIEDLPVSEATTDALVETTQQLETEHREPLDLTGLWIQKDPPASYMVAKIQEDGTIGVFFMLENDKESAWTYWVGTYQAPETAESEYEWTSVNTYGGNGLLASSAEDKTFTYSDGMISFSVTIQGETSTIHLVRGDWDTSMIPQNAFTAVKVPTGELQPLEIRDSAWLLVSDKWLYYYVDMYNPNEDTAIEFPTVRVTARDANNVLLDTDDQVMSIIYPKQHFIYAGQAFSVDETPTTVDFEVLEPKDYSLKKINESNQYVPLEVINSGLRSDKVVGEIVNNNNYDISMAIVIVLLKDSDGNVIGMDSTFVSDVKTDGTTPFSISIRKLDGVASFECYANQW